MLILWHTLHQKLQKSNITDTVQAKHHPTAMQMLILAGGLGTRLKDLTKNTPKPMIEFGGKPFLEYLILNYRRQGVKNFILSVGYLNQQVIDYFNDGDKWNVQIQYSVEEDPLGTAGAIKQAEKLLKEEFFVTNGDTFMDINVKKVKNFHSNNRSLATLAVLKAKRKQNSGVIKLNSQGGILDFHSSEKSNADNFINAGFYLMKKEILDDIPQGKVSLENEVFPKIKNMLKAVEIVPEYFIDIGTFDTYNRFKQELNKAQNVINDQIKSTG